MLSVKLWEVLLKMKNRVSSISRQLSTLTMPINTKLYTSICREKKDIINTCTSMSTDLPPSFTCSMSARDQHSNELSNGLQSASGHVKFQSKSSLETRLTSSHQVAQSAQAELKSRLCQIQLLRLKQSTLPASMEWSILKHAASEKHQ